MLIESIRAPAQFGAERFTPVTPARTEHSDMQVVRPAAAQAIPVHHPSRELTLAIINGEATLVAGVEKLARAGPGAVLPAKVGQARASHADKRTVVVVVASPPAIPADPRDSAGRVAKDTWRPSRPGRAHGSGSA